MEKKVCNVFLVISLIIYKDLYLKLNLDLLIKNLYNLLYIIELHINKLY